MEFLEAFKYFIIMLIIALFIGIIVAIVLFFESCNFKLPIEEWGSVDFGVEWFKTSFPDVDLWERVKEVIHELK